MNILIVGADENYQEAKEKLTAHQLTHVEELSELTEKDFFETELVFDFISQETPESLHFYEQKPELVIFLNTVMTSFLDLFVFVEPIKNTIFGFNGLPTFFNRPILEATLSDTANKEMLLSLVKKLEWDVEIVDDRVAMATPRIITMIINEAYYTVQEGTATKEDIDQGMKLGTNYPHGPFEWCEKIGIENVFEILNSIYEDTKEERYKICPLLKKEYLKAIA
jgi:3-hydroxybutyryl-CoA dehydrogenase